MDDRNMKKKVNRRKNLIRIGAVGVLIITIYIVTAVLGFKSPHGIDQLEGIYKQPKNTMDVVFMGTSHVHCGINTGLLWEKYGIASYDYSGAEQPLWMTYHYLKELYKYQSPKMIVLDLYAPARFKEDYQYDWMAENIHGMRFSLNKLQMIRASIEPHRIDDYFPSFAVYHSRYDDLKEEDFNDFFWNEHEQIAFKGFTPYWEQMPQIKPEIGDVESGGLSDKSEKYLRKIMELTKEHGSELALIVVPYVIKEEDKKTYNRILEIATEEGIYFVDYNEYYEEMGLDFITDFNDESHLNYWGSCKFTDFLGSYLECRMEIPDRSGLEEYDSWNDNADLIYEELRVWQESIFSNKDF